MSEIDATAVQATAKPINPPTTRKHNPRNKFCRRTTAARAYMVLVYPPPHTPHRAATPDGGACPGATRRTARARRAAAEAVVLTGYRNYIQSLADQAAPRLRGPAGEGFASRLESEYADSFECGAGCRL